MAEVGVFTESEKRWHQKLLAVEGNAVRARVPSGGSSGARPMEAVLGW
jgi:hypothetical protein